MIDEEGQPGNWHDEELHAECVVVAVICGTELEEHKVHGGHSRCNEDQLHCSVVDGHKVCEEIEVSTNEHHGEHYLCLAGNTCT